MLRRGDASLFDELVIRLGMEEVAADPRFANGGREAMGVGRYAAKVKGIWEEAFKDLTTDQVLELIREHGGEAMPFMDYPSMAEHPQIEALGIFQDVEYPGHGVVKAVGAPWDFPGAPTPSLGRAPRLGEHTREVLDLLGYTREQIRSLGEKGAIILGGI